MRLAKRFAPLAQEFCPRAPISMLRKTNNPQADVLVHEPRRVCALTIAGSDSGGCSGIQADLKTFAALGVHGLCAITAATAQTLRSVEALGALRPTVVAAQIDAAFSGFDPAAVKIGMLASAANLAVIAGRLRQHAARNVVLDPVLAASSGTPLLPPRALAMLLRELCPLADVLTPNVPEAELLLGRRLRRAADLPHAARDLLATGAGAILLKGGHLRGAIVRDWLADASDTVEFAHDRLNVRARGTGCSLSAAIAAHLALGSTLAEAVRQAERFLQAAMRHAYAPARGPRRALDPLAAMRRPK